MICEECKNSKLFIFNIYDYYLNEEFIRDIIPMINSIIMLDEPAENVEIAYWKRAKFIPHESIFYSGYFFETIKADLIMKYQKRKLNNIDKKGFRLT